MFLRLYRKRIAQDVESKMQYLNTCLNERNIFLHIIAPKDYDALRKLHCNDDCTNTKCNCYKNLDKLLSSNDEDFKD